MSKFGKAPHNAGFDEINVLGSGTLSHHPERTRMFLGMLRREALQPSQRTVMAYRLDMATLRQCSWWRSSFPCSAAFRLLTDLSSGWILFTLWLLPVITTLQKRRSEALCHSFPTRPPARPHNELKKNKGSNTRLSDGGQIPIRRFLLWWSVRLALAACSKSGSGCYAKVRAPTTPLAVSSPSRRRSIEARAQGFEGSQWLVEGHRSMSGDGHMFFA